MKISHLQENLTPSSAPIASVPGPKFGRSDEMLESGASTTTAGVMATGSPANMGVQRRSKKGSDLLKGIKTSEKYANSRKAGISEDAINEDDLSEEQLQAKKRREELFKRSKDREIGKKPVSRDILPKTTFEDEEYDDEAGMIKSNLHTAARAIHGLNEVIQSGDNVPEWVQEKIAIASDYFVTVWDYMLSEREIQNGDNVQEGAKVDRMVKHVKSSEKKLGHSDKEAENIAWATANKRGMLDNKNKKVKKGVAEESKGLWANIHAKRERIKHGSGERMRKPGSKGAPTADALRKSAK